MPKFDDEAAEEINKIFFEVIIAPSYTEKALEIHETKEKQDNFGAEVAFGYKDAVPFVFEWRFSSGA